MSPTLPSMLSRRARVRGEFRHPGRWLALALAGVLAVPLVFACIEPIPAGPQGDRTPPSIGGGQPTGLLAAGTTETTIGVMTDEPATCRWGTSSTLDYDVLPSQFTTTGGATHSAMVSGLQDGGNYSYHVRCRDAAGNANDASYTIAFSVIDPADATPPVVSGAQPSGVLPAGTTQTTMAVGTNEPATCRWSMSASDAFAVMPEIFATTGGISHSTPLTGLADGQSYSRYVRCQDAAGNANTTSQVVAFSVASPGDLAAPVISNPLPSGTLAAGTRQVTIRVTTNEAATCRFGAVDASYAQLTSAFPTTGGTTHTAILVGIADGQTYTFYVRCQDQVGNANGSSAIITFSVDAPDDLTASGD
jgi:hypothetical protein